MDQLSRFLQWHYLIILPKLLLIWKNFTLFPFYYCSIPLHLKTLFSPWKKQTTKMRIGFHLDDFISVLIFNLFARILGFIMKMTVILFGLFFMPIIFILFLLLILFWLLAPFLTIPIYLGSKPDRNTFGQYLLNCYRNDLQKLSLKIFKTAEGKYIAEHLNLDYNNLLFYLTNQNSKGDYQTFLKNLKKGQSCLMISNLLQALFLSYPPLSTIINNNHIKEEELTQTALWFEQLDSLTVTPLLLDLKRIKSMPGIGSDWAYGYTVEFDKYSRDLTNHGPFPLLVGRNSEIQKMEDTLIKTERNNVFIVGEPGIGRHIISETLAHRIVTGQTHPALSHKRILYLDMHALISAYSTIAEVKGLAANLLIEAETAGNVIVVIDDIDRYLSTGEGKFDFSDIFRKFAQSSVGLIGITSPEGYHSTIVPNSSIIPLFETIELGIPSLDTVLTDLMISVTPILERKYHIIITYAAIKKTVYDADKYITDTPFPAKAIELIDQACVHLITRKKERVLTAQNIDQFLTEKMNIPIGELQKNETEILVNLENILHKRIINQESAIHAIASSLRRRRLNVSSGSKPIGSFLFLGPTGVGKTETAKALASVYFTSEERMLRFDMSQYQKEEGVERLIGSAKNGLPGELTSKLRDKPFSLILLDEFEKTDIQIFNLFLTLLDEGYISNASGKKTDARNSMIIATSNAGAEYIREKIQKGDSQNIQKDLINYLQTEKIFSPELINRFDAVIVFSILSEGHMREVARLMLDSLNKRLAAKEVSVNVTPALISKLVEKGFDPQFGARSMRRFIEEVVEDQIVHKLLSGQTNKGEKITIIL